MPRGTALDTWRGRTYVSVVGFLFRDTRVLGVPVPWHRTFEEVNLRLYVRREVAGEIRRAVTFIRELVPRRAIAAVARLAYNEPYVARPMRHHLPPHRPPRLLRHVRRPGHEVADRLDGREDGGQRGHRESLRRRPDAPTPAEVAGAGLLRMPRRPRPPGRGTVSGQRTPAGVRTLSVKVSSSRSAWFFSQP